MVIDAGLPIRLAERLAAPARMTVPDSRAVATWIAESPGMLKEYAQRRLAYIPFGTGSVVEGVLPLDSAWKRQLQEGRWVFTAAGGGPYRPGDVLTEPDPARPDAPVADLPPDFLRALREAGLVFGARLPDAPAVLRLRVQGPSAPADEVLRLARAALGEARSDPKKLDFLKETFRGSNLFPLPPGRQSPDRLSRVPLDCVVRSERGRSAFGSWLATADSFPGGSPESQLFELAGSVLPIPEVATARHALNYLAWVWREQPDADRVRNQLPRAYQYLREDLSPDLKSQLDRLRASAVVYASGRRQWLPVADEAVFLNDFPDEEALPAQAEVTLATPGHLGDERADQAAVAALLGLKLLSTRFRVSTLPARAVPVPDHWQRAFARVQQDLSRRFGASAADESEVPSTPERTLFTLSRWEQIEVVVWDRGVETDRSPRRASASDGVIAVTGQPEEFAEAVCRLLFNAWGLRLRRDLVDLIPAVAIQLARIGDARFPVDPPRAEPDGDAEASSGSDSDEEDEDDSDAAEPSELEGEEDGAGAEDSEESDEAAPGGTGADREGRSGPTRERRSPDPGAPTPVRHRGSGTGRNGGGDGSGHRGPERERTDAGAGRGHTAVDREGIIGSLLERRAQLDAQLWEAAATGVIPAADPSVPGEDPSTRPFQSDARFRAAVNLNTHGPWSLYEAFEPARARAIAERLEWHYTPKHGSWLNVAECELATLSGQCLDRRIGSVGHLRKLVGAWVEERNERMVGVNWRFTTANARIKLRSLYPSIRE